MRAAAIVGALLVVALAGCTGDSDDSNDDEQVDGVLRVSDLDGDDWSTSDEGGGTLCSGLAGMLRSMSGASERSAEVTLEGEGVMVVSQAWMANPPEGTRRADFERMRSHADSCEPSPDPGDQGFTEFEIVDDGSDSFVVHERRVIQGVEGGSDQLYFREGDAVGVVSVNYEGAEAPLSVTELEQAARSRAGELIAAVDA